MFEPESAEPPSTPADQRGPIGRWLAAHIMRYGPHAMLSRDFPQQTVCPHTTFWPC